MSDLKQQVRDIINSDEAVTINGISRAIGISNAALSQWLSGKYQGKNENVDKAVNGFLERYNERMSEKIEDLKFVETSVAERVFEVARMAHLESEIGVICGDAGLGKTHAVKEYADRNTDVILIEADLGYTAPVLFRHIHKKLGLGGIGRLHDMFEDIVDKLRKSGRLIIIDEAEHLPYRALELLRRVYDKAGVGILMVGMPKLIHNLRGKKGEFAQLYSRVHVFVSLESLKPHDTEMIVNNAVKNKNGIWRIFHEVSGGNTRVLSKLLNRTIKLSEINNTQMNKTLIKEASKTLLTN